MAARKGYLISPRYEFRRLLSTNRDIIETAVSLLQTYRQREDEIWRTIWLIYFLQDVTAEPFRYESVESGIIEIARTIEMSNNVPLVARLWASKLIANKEDDKSSTVEILHEAGYVEAGVRLYGSKYV